MKPSETLKRALALIQTYGWVQARMGSRSCGYCAVGAISQALNGESVIHNPHEFSEARRFLAQAISGDQYAGVVSWNDQPDRTEAEVRSAFSQAIQLAEEAKQ